MRSTIHLLLHAAVPALAAALFWRRRFVRSFLILLAAWAIDVDHLLAVPIYDPNRCSIGFHPLHTLPLAAVYVALMVQRKTRLIGLGLVLHLLLDGIDCLMMIG